MFQNLNPLKRGNSVFIWLLLLWITINTTQALVTEILSDEAYYSLWGAKLSFGYFDHPPMVALLTKISSLLFTGNLGVRFMSIVLQAATLLLIWKLIDYKGLASRKAYDMFIIAGSMALFGSYGFLTTPDAPLLFFTALFLLAYKHFTSKNSWSSTLLMAVAMSGMVYSKYQAVLVIGFTILSNLRLLTNYRFWLSGVLAILLTTPHFAWQIANDFPSFQYHLIHRSEDFKWQYFFEYIPNQLVTFNPVTLGAAIYVLYKYKPKDAFNRALFFQIIGFIGFFWIMSFRGHIQAHWTIAACIPMIIMLTQMNPLDAKLSRYTRKFILPSIALVFLLRILISIDTPIARAIGFSGKIEKYSAVSELAGDRPVISKGSFQNPSVYTYYTGKPATVISSYYNRMSQYDIWQKEKLFHNKPVFVYGNFRELSSEYQVGNQTIKGFYADHLQTVNRMRIEFSVNDQTVQPGNSISIPFELINPYPYSIDFKHSEFPVRYRAVLQANGKPTKYIYPSLSNNENIIPANARVSNTATIMIPDDFSEGEYTIALSLYNLFGPAFNSKPATITIAN